MSEKFDVVLRHELDAVAARAQTCGPRTSLGAEASRRIRPRR